MSAPERRSDAPGWSHLDHEGNARMVDVSAKASTPRRARALGAVRMAPATLVRIREGETLKGNVLGVARIAGIQAAKQTSTLVPLCHPLPLDRVTVDFRFVDPTRIEICAEAAVTARTGVEMEALTAVAIAALTVYDMCKAIDPDMVIEQIRLEEKSGGRRGLYRHPLSER